MVVFWCKFCHMWLESDRYVFQIIDICPLSVLSVLNSECLSVGGGDHLKLEYMMFFNNISGHKGY